VTAAPAPARRDARPIARTTSIGFVGDRSETTNVRSRAAADYWNTMIFDCVTSC
jgi:hypothetical protein